MRVLAWLVGLPIAAIVVLFAVSNRELMSVGLWPFTDGIEAPAYVVGLIPLAIGLLLGAGFAAIGTMRARLRHRAERRKVRAMERNLAELRASAATSPAHPAISAPAAPPPPLP